MTREHRSRTLHVSVANNLEIELRGIGSKIDCFRFNATKPETFLFQNVATGWFAFRGTARRLDPSEQASSGLYTLHWLFAEARWQTATRSQRTALFSAEVSMTMVRLHDQIIRAAVRVAGLGLLGMFCSLALAAQPLWAQRGGMHFQHAGVMPPGAIGRLQLERGGPLAGYYQPVEIRVPKGALISPAAGDAFAPPTPDRLLIGLAISPVYRLQVTRIPDRPGVEVYPTIEIVDRLYPPAGQKWRFPIPIDLTERELEMAADGKFVTRVIYLEDPDRASPLAEDPDEQTWFEVAPGADPLVVADELGRPMAILRIGGRLPDRETGPDAQFLYGSPPWITPTAGESEPIIRE